jgi:hypothetical protein
MSIAMKWYFTLTVILLCSCWILRAQKTGTGQEIVSNYRGPGLTPFHEGLIEKNIFISPEIIRLKPSPFLSLKNKINTCLSFFSNDTLYGSMKGVRITFTGRATLSKDKSSPSQFPVFGIEVGFHTIHSGDSIPLWSGDPDAWLTVTFNNPLKLTGYPIIQDIYEEPLVTGDFFGHREYHRISVPHRMVAVKNNPGAFFDPVTREDFLLTLISYFQMSLDKEEKPQTQPSKEPVLQATQWNRENAFKKFEEHLKEIRKYDPLLAQRLEAAYREEISAKGIQPLPGDINKVDRIIALATWREAVRKLKAEMNAMSPLERKSQAWWSNSENANVSGLTPAGYSGSRPLVRINKNLVDKSRSPSDIQLIVIEWPEILVPETQDQTGFNPASSKLFRILENETLWNQVFTMLNR